jgi:hypothetical protein
MMEDQNGIEQGSPGGGSGMNLFWGIVFTIIAFVELSRGMYVIAGIPIWAICLFVIGIANFLKFPKIAYAVAGGEKRIPLVRKVANILNITGLAVLLISIAIVYLG